MIMIFFRAFGRGPARRVGFGRGGKAGLADGGGGRDAARTTHFRVGGPSLSRLAGRARPRPTEDS